MWKCRWPTRSSTFCPLGPSEVELIGECRKPCPEIWRPLSAFVRQGDDVRSRGGAGALRRMRATTLPPCLHDACVSDAGAGCPFLRKPARPLQPEETLHGQRVLSKPPAPAITPLTCLRWCTVFFALRYPFRLQLSPTTALIPLDAHTTAPSPQHAGRVDIPARAAAIFVARANLVVGIRHVSSQAALPLGQFDADCDNA